MKKKKILFLVQMPPPVHGASLMNKSLVESRLLQESYNIRILDITTAKNIDDIGGFSFRKIFSFFSTFFKLLWELIAFRPSLVYFTVSPTGFAFYRDAFYILLIKLAGRKRVLHLHGKGIQKRMNKSTYRFTARFIFRNSYTIHLSPLLANDVAGLNIKKKFIVNNGIPVTAVTKKNNQGGKLRLLYLSNYVKSKGILDLVDAIEIVAKSSGNFELNLVGKPFDIETHFLKKYISDKKLDAYINVCGPKYNDEKLEQLNNAQMLVFPTYYPNEAFPLTLLEAMQYSLAIITTTEGGIPDMIDDEKTGLLVPAKDPEKLAEKIIYLIKNPVIREQLGTRTNKVFRERFTFAIFEENMIKVFKETTD